jgi:hypothetical protein
MRRDATIRTSVLLLALAAIALLAIGLPFGAVQWLHTRRLRSADKDLATLATRLDLHALHSGLHEGVGVLLGPGDTPRAVDARWVTSTTYPLSRVDASARADPWGNAYIVNLAASREGNTAVWVLSAGPDGVIQTPFRQPGPGAAPSGDDRATRLQPASAK